MAKQWIRKISDYLSTSSDSFISATIGDVPGIVPKSVYGFNADISASPQDIWTGPTSLYTGQRHELISLCYSSDNEKDAINNSGARRIEVFGLDSEYNEVSTTLDMFGNTETTTDLLWRRCTYVRVVNCGIGNTNLGTINIRQTGKDPSIGTFANIHPLEVASTAAAFTVPVGKSALLLDYNLVAHANESTGYPWYSLVNLLARPMDGVYTPLDVSSISMTGVTNKINFTGIILPEKTDVVARVMSSSVSFAGGCRINYLLINNSMVNMRRVKYAV